jgi:universal stress protein family protein
MTGRSRRTPWRLEPTAGIRAAKWFVTLKCEGQSFLATEAQRTGELPAWQLLREGKPAGQILAAAREWEADVIVTGSHGRSGVLRLVLGKRPAVRRWSSGSGRSGRFLVPRAGQIFVSDTPFLVFNRPQEVTQQTDSASTMYLTPDHQGNGLLREATQPEFEGIGHA